MLISFQLYLRIHSFFILVDNFILYFALMSGQSLSKIFQLAKVQQKYMMKLLDIGRQRGFDNFINRKLIWSFLLKVPIDPLNQSRQSIIQWNQSLDEKDKNYQQLQKDAQRSLASMKTFENINKFHLRKRQAEVFTVLNSFFAKNRDLNYIQGFHDVASIFLIVYGKSLGYCMMEQAGKIYFKDFLTYDIGSTGTMLSKLIFDIVVKKDPDFQKIFEVYEPSRFLIFILPWVLTWFAHVFSSVKTIARIWDYILCTGPHGIVYLSAGIILSTKQQLKKQCSQFDEPNIQTFYQQQAKRDAIDIQASIAVAIDLQKQFSLQQLKDFASFEDNSIFRLKNLYNYFPFFKTFHEYLKKKQKNKQLIKKSIKIFGLAVVATAAIYTSYKFGKPQWIWKASGQL